MHDIICIYHFPGKNRIKLSELPIMHKELIHIHDLFIKEYYTLQIEYFTTPYCRIGLLHIVNN